MLASRPRSSRALLALGLALLAAAVVVRLPGLGRSLFYDELFTAKHFATSLHDALLTQKQANNHPLASLLAWLSTQLLGRDDALALRAPSVLVGALAVVATAWLAGRRASPAVAVTGGLLALVHPAHVGFSQEVRGYALVLLFAPLATRLALDVLEGEARAVGFLAVSVALGVWAHATFGVLALGLAAYLLFCKGVGPGDRRRALLGVVGGALLGVVLLAPTLSHLGKFAAGNTGLSGESGGLPNLERAGAVVEMLSVGDARLGAGWPLGVALATLVALGLARPRSVAGSPRRPSVEGAILSVLATTAVVWLVARPLFYARFFAFLLPLVVVLAARGAAVAARRLGGGKEKRALVLFWAAPLVVGWACATGERASWETQPTKAAIQLAVDEGGSRGVMIAGEGSELFPDLRYAGDHSLRASLEWFYMRSYSQDVHSPIPVIVELFPERRDRSLDMGSLEDWERLYHLHDEVICEFPGLYSNVVVHRLHAR